jgi:hypothetical protein
MITTGASDLDHYEQNLYDRQTVFIMFKIGTSVLDLSYYDKNLYDNQTTYVHMIKTGTTSD